MTATAFGLDELVAHRPPMRLLDRMIEISAEGAVAETIVRDNNPLFVPGRGLPAYAGLEMMAQAIAAIDGIKRNMDGLPPKIGFLLGCRRYSVRCADFEEGSRLRVAAKMVFSDGEMFSFECSIDGEDGVQIARANMNVYAPTNPQAYLKDGVA